ncbi:MASE1 domain-containing protein [Qipengyuania sp. RANM35]|uniref:MASE1 domain-containing protein n=1 Tax=Qipengyuania sp. RANM35 TaxID=3068635 RepID=UPI0034DB4AA2
MTVSTGLQPTLPAKRSQDLRQIAIAGVACIGFTAFAYFSIDLTRSGGRIASIWLPNALAVAFLLRFRMRTEWAILVAMGAGNVAANLLQGDDLGHALMLSSANLLEIVIATRLSRHWCKGAPQMDDTGDLLRFSLAAGLVAPVSSALVASLALAESVAELEAIYLKWAIADALSLLILAPSCMIAIDAIRNRRRPTRQELAEWLVLSVFGTSVTLVIFLQNAYPLLFLVPPVVVAHAFRLGLLGTAFSTMKVAIIAMVCTELGNGPINLLAYDRSEQLLVLEAFLASAIVVGLPVAAILATRKRMTDALITQRSELALLAENVTDAILRYDEHGLCTYASPSTLNVLGMPPEKFVGLSPSERLHPDSYDSIRAVEERLLSGASPKERFTYRRYLDAPDGSPVFIEADCAVATNARTGARDGIVVSARDVTARVELEQRLKRAMRHAENAARAKAQFLANMSHEIRTPMNGVLGFAELLQRQGLEGDAGRYARLIERSGRSMMMLLNDILDISKIESGKLVVSSEPILLSQLAADCVELHATQAERKGINLDLVFDEDLPRHIESDPLRLRQILLNLIGNAIKFTETGTIIVSVMREGKRLSLSVEDSGIGIDEARLETIFDPFVQAEGDTTRRFGGTGLGLSISRQLAQLLGGTLTVDSMPGVGSRFALRIPIVEPDIAAASPEESGQSKVSAPPGGRVLLAEDHDVNRMLVTAMLEELGQEVEVVHDGVSAIEAIFDAQAGGRMYDLVLMDIQMPGCDGYAATRTVRAGGIGPDQLPIVALTANAYPEDIAAAQDAGMQAHLAKPLVFEDLAAALARWLPVRIIDDAREPPRIPARKPASTAPELNDRWALRRSEAIEAVSNAVRCGTMDGEGIEDLARTVHKLAGTAGMFGEEELGVRAAALERALRSSVEPEVRQRLAEELLQAA